MATAEELLNSISKNQVSVLSEDDGIFVIDGESRTIIVPDSERLFGVEGDKDVERKYFQCPKIVGDNIDLSQHQIYVSYVFTTTENNTIFPTIGNGLYHCEDVEVSGDNITFSWLLSGNVFANPGFIAFKVMAKKSEGSELKTKWNTAPAIGTVLLTVPDGEEIAEEYPDIINQLLTKMESVEQIATPEAMQEYVNAYLEENPVTGGMTAEQEQQLNKNTEDISSLSEDIDYKFRKYDSISDYGAYEVDPDNIEKFGSATVVKEEKSYKVTLLGVNDGIITSNRYPADNYIKISGEIRNESVNDGNILIQIAVIKNNLSVTYYHIKNITIDAGYSKKFNEIIYIPDLTPSAKEIRILINHIETDAVGLIFYVDDLRIGVASKLINYDFYSQDFETMIQKLYEETRNKNENEEKSNVVSGRDGKKYISYISKQGNLSLKSTNPVKTLFIGNSLLNGMAGPDGLYGMCSSSPNNDFYYYVKEEILKSVPSASFTKLHPRKMEQCDQPSDIDDWINSSISSFTEDLDLVIIQIGDNVNNDDRITNFDNGFYKVIESIIDNSPTARIILVGIWFYNSKVYDTLLKNAEKYGLEIIDIHDLNTAENQGYSGQQYLSSDGTLKTVDDTWITHPGDIGMRKIADRIIERLQLT